MLERVYEGMFILNQSADVEKSESSISSLIENFGGNVLEIKSMGLQKLAYPIKRELHGFYFLFYFKFPINKLDKLRFELSLRGSFILRYMLIVLDEKNEKAFLSKISQNSVEPTSDNLVQSDASKDLNQDVNEN